MVETSSNPSIGRIVASYIEKIGLSVRYVDINHTLRNRTGPSMTTTYATLLEYKWNTFYNLSESNLAFDRLSDLSRWYFRHCLITTTFMPTTFSVCPHFNPHNLIDCDNGAGDGIRTRTQLNALDFKSKVSYQFHHTSKFDYYTLYNDYSKISFKTSL